MARPIFPDGYNDTYMSNPFKREDNFCDLCGSKLDFIENIREKISFDSQTGEKIVIKIDKSFKACPNEKCERRCQSVGHDVIDLFIAAWCKRCGKGFGD